MRRMILIPIMVFVILLAISGGVGYYLFNSYTYYSTDDAQLTAPIVAVSAPGAGQLKTLTVQPGDTVTAGEIIGSIATGAPKPLELTSPIDGTVVQVTAVEGQGVAPGVPLLQVANLNVLKVTAYVDESAINNIKIGQAVDIKVDAYSGTSFSGHVQQIIQATAGSFSLLPSQDSASGNFSKVSQRIPVIITLDGNGGKSLMPGMSSEISIHIH
jgi:multidrug resistance efflux pump